MPFPVDEKYILQTEEKLQVKFPDTFRRKMMDENGGEVLIEVNDEDNWRLFPFYDSTDIKRIKRTANDIIRENNVAHEKNGFPENGIAFAYDSGGNHLIFFKRRTKCRIKRSCIFLAS